jgi:hypothetical protein
VILFMGFHSDYTHSYVSSYLATDIIGMPIIIIIIIIIIILLLWLYSPFVWPWSLFPFLNLIY